MKNLEKGTAKILKNKGQALVEFVLLLPILILVLFIIIDFANIFYNKNHLEGILNDVVTMVENNYSKKEIEKVIANKNIIYIISIEDNYATIKLEEKINFITPFSNKIFNDNYKITTQRVILYE